MKTFWERLIDILFIVSLCITIILLISFIIIAIFMIWKPENNELYTNLILTDILLLIFFGILSMILGTEVF